MISKLIEVFESSVVTKLNTSDLFKGDRGDYTSLSNLSKKVGLYMFKVIETDKVIYIGESSLKTHGLKKRVTQHLTIGNTGGTLPKNMVKFKFSKDKNSALNYLKKNTYIEIIELDLSKAEIKMLESIAIALYNPKFNFKKTLK